MDMVHLIAIKTLVVQGDVVNQVLQGCAKCKSTKLRPITCLVVASQLADSRPMMHGVVGTPQNEVESESE